jgi:hypothetical protein
MRANVDYSPANIDWQIFIGKVKFKFYETNNRKLSGRRARSVSRL